MKTTRRLAEWLERRAAAPDTPPVKPQSPRQPIYLNLKRKAGEASEVSEASEAEKPEPETFLLPRAAKPRDEDFKEQGRSRLPQQQPRSGSL